MNHKVAEGEVYTHARMGDTPPPPVHTHTQTHRQLEREGKRVRR